MAEGKAKRVSKAKTAKKKRSKRAVASTKTKSQSTADRPAVEKKVAKGETRKPSESRSAYSVQASDEFLSQVYFDRKTQQFVGSVLEIPAVKVTSNNKDQLEELLNKRITEHLSAAKKRGDSLPEPIQSRTYPERLDFPISQGLYRRIDLLSKQERVPVEALVSELLVTGLNRREVMRKDNNRRDHREKREHRDRSDHNRRDGNRRDHNNNRRDGNQGGNFNKRRGQGGYSFNRMQHNGDNFMEYVRNLEKNSSGGGGRGGSGSGGGGGNTGGGNWNKR